MATKTQVLDWFRSQLGYVEGSAALGRWADENQTATPDVLPADAETEDVVA